MWKSRTAGGTEDGTSTLENRFWKHQTYPYAMARPPYSWASIPGKWKLMFLKKLLRIVRGGFVLTAEDWNNFPRGSGQTSVVHPHQGVLFSSEREPVLEASANLDVSQRHHAKWTKRVSKYNMLCDSIYRAFSKWWNFKDGKQIGGLQSPGIEGGGAGGGRDSESAMWVLPFWWRSRTRQLLLQIGTCVTVPQNHMRTLYQCQVLGLETELSVGAM